MFLFSGMSFVRYIWLLLLGCISLGTENNICRRWIVCMCVCACITQTVNLPLWSQFFPIFFSLQNKTPWEKLLLLSLLLKLCIRHSSACPAVFLNPSPKVLASFLWQSKDCHHHHSCIAFFAFVFKTGLPTWQVFLCGQTVLDLAFFLPQLPSLLPSLSTWRILPVCLTWLLNSISQPLPVCFKAMSLFWLLLLFLTGV